MLTVAQNWRAEPNGWRKPSQPKILWKMPPRKRKRNAARTNQIRKGATEDLKENTIILRTKLTWTFDILILALYSTIHCDRSKLDTDVRKVASWQVEENITEEVLDKKINELVASRGRKNTDPREVLRKLEVLSKSARPLGARKEIPVLMHLISAMFDSQRGKIRWWLGAFLQTFLSAQ